LIVWRGPYAPAVSNPLQISSSPPSTGGEGGEGGDVTKIKSDKKAWGRQWEASCKDWEKEWVQKEEVLKEEVQWVGFMNINDMYNNDVGKGVVYAYEAYEAK